MRKNIAMAIVERAITLGRAIQKRKHKLMYKSDKKMIKKINRYFGAPIIILSVVLSLTY